MAFGGSDSDNYKRSPPEKIEPIEKVNPLFISQRVRRNPKPLVTPKNQPKSSVTPRENKSIFAMAAEANTSKKKADDIDLHFEFNKWQRC